jgi:hypothetical protein
MVPHDTRYLSYMNQRRGVRKDDVLTVYSELVPSPPLRCEHLCMLFGRGSHTTDRAHVL